MLFIDRISRLKRSLYVQRRKKQLRRERGGRSGRDAGRAPRLTRRPCASPSSARPSSPCPTLERLLAGRASRSSASCRSPIARAVAGASSRPRRSPRARSRAGIPLLRPEQVGDAPRSSCAARARARPRRRRRLRPVPAEARARAAARCGYLINAHASLLPRWRGAAPIARAILAGDTRDRHLGDARRARDGRGPRARSCASSPIGADENAASSSSALAALAADAHRRGARRDRGRHASTWTQQDAARATLAPKLERERGAARLRASRARRSCAACAPSRRRPGALHDSGGRAAAHPRARAPCAARSTRAPGHACARRRDGALRIATGDGWLVPLALQRAGGRALDAAEFLRGRAIPDGAQLGAASSDGAPLGSDCDAARALAAACIAPRPRRGRPRDAPRGAARRRPRGADARARCSRCACSSACERARRLRRSAAARALSRAAPLSAPTARFATELVYGTLRWRGRLDFLLAQRASTAISTSSSRWCATALRLGAYQILLLRAHPRLGGRRRVGALRARARRRARRRAS